MFERPHHQRIAQVLDSFDAPIFLNARCLFGGGTAVALLHGEFRESVDIDFICSSVDGYRELRSRITQGGIAALQRTPIAVLREPRIDHYGIRCAFVVDSVPIKFEIIFEGRIELSEPDPAEVIKGVATLCQDDRVATKLMANSDRWADDAVLSRDLIDLSMLTESGLLPAVGIAKARRAYGDSVAADVVKAKSRLLDRPGRLTACVKGLGITLTEAALRARVQRLRVKAELAGS